MGISKLSVFQTQWVGFREDKWSPSENNVFVGGNLVSSKRKKQRVVSPSSVESEYRAMT